MYPRSNGGGPPVALIIVGGMLLVFGGYFVWNGLVSFMSAQGDITAPVTQQANALIAQTQAIQAIPSPIVFPSATPPRICLDFRVSVVKARVRDCPKDSCTAHDTLYSQGALMCVYGPAPGATDWYEVNLRPTGSFPQIGYMSSSVLYAVNPTHRPTMTFTPLPTVTPVPITPTTPTASATVMSLPNPPSTAKPPKITAEP